MRRLTLLVAMLCMLAAVATAAPSKPANGDHLYPARRHGKWGYIDGTAKVRIEPRYADVGAFHDGVAQVKDGATWRCIDSSGSTLFDLQTEEEGWLVTTRSLSSGRFAVKRGDLYGYVDAKGTLVIPAAHEFANDFSEGVALVVDKGVHRYIDPQGRQAIPAFFAEGSSFFDGLAAVRPEQSGRWGYIDRTGRMVIEPRFDSANEFHDGTATVRVGDRYGVIDRTGKMLVEPRFAFISWEFDDGLAFASEDKAHYGYIDRSGRWVVPARYAQCGHFGEGIAPAKTDQGPAFIDRAGKVVLPIPQPYIFAFDFDGPLALLQAKGNPAAAWMDRRGRVVWVND